MNLILSAVLVSCLGILPSTTDLTVQINDIENPGEGTIYVMLWDNAEGFPSTTSNAKYVATITSFGASCSHVFKGIPTGEYAVSIYQDENDNEEMDSNFLGIPKEPIGASGMTRLSKPTFAKSAITLDQAQQVVNIKMMND